MPDHKTLAIARWPLSRDQAPPRPRARLFEPLRNGLRLGVTGPRTELPSMLDGTCETRGFMVHAPTCAHVRPAAPPQPASRDARPDIGDYNGAYANRFASAAQESAEQPASRCSDGAGAEEVL